MKTLNLSAAFLLLLAGQAFAASTVSDVIARQRWPWNGKVDIDFTVTGDTTNVDFMATWQGQSSPVLLGTAYDAAAGQHRFEFDPATLGLTNQTLTGFTVTATDPAAHTYLVLDLVNGGYSYLADVPSGGWTDEHKSGKMVFRRIPKGNYLNGVPDLTVMFGSGVGPVRVLDGGYGKPAQYMYKHSANYSSDFYLAIYPMTIAQYARVANRQSSSDYKIQEISYNDLRGSAANDIMWPQTRHEVAADSFVAKMRTLSNGQLTIDLPMEDQWEVASRCGQTTVFAEGGQISTSDFEVMTNILNQTAVWAGNGDTGYVPVGTKNANPWGLYDMNGMSLEWTVNTDMWNINATRTIRLCVGSDALVDYVGRTYSTNTGDKKSNRVVKGCPAFDAANPLYYYFPSYRSLRSPAETSSLAARLCIYLNPLDFTTAKN